MGFLVGLCPTEVEMVELAEANGFMAEIFELVSSRRPAPSFLLLLYADLEFEASNYRKTLPPSMTHVNVG